MILGRMGLTERARGRVYDFMLAVWKMVADAHGGQVDRFQSKRIETATRIFAEAKRAQERLALAEIGKIALSEEQVMGYSDRVVRNHVQCDKVLEALGLNRDPQEALFAQLYGKPALPNPPDAQNRPEGRPAPDVPPEGQESVTTNGDNA
jgi:hypothetical protein